MILGLGLVKVRLTDRRVPALTERRTDIPLLAQRFLATVIEREGLAQLTLSEETVRTLVAYSWPGNVRELESAIEYAVLHARGHEIVPDDLPEKLQSVQVRAAARSPLSALFEDLPSLDELERRYLLIARVPLRSSASIVARCTA